MHLVDSMQSVILMGGMGTRLKNKTFSKPKPMVDVHRKPFIFYQLQLLKWQGIKEFVFCVAYKGDVIQDYFGDGKNFGVHITYSYDGEELLGTAGALKKASQFLKDDFLILYGDSYMDIDYSEVIYRYKVAKTRSHAQGMMVVFKNTDRYGKSNVIFKDGKLIYYDKQTSFPEMEHIDYGVSILSKDLLSDIPEGHFADLADLCHKKIEEKKIEGYESKNRFYEIGTPESLEEFKTFIFERIFVSKPAIFLDRDGTLNEPILNRKTGELDSPLDFVQLKLFPEIVKTLRVFQSMGYLLIVVTNQPAAAKGKASLGALYDVNHRLREILKEEHVVLDDVLMCPHHPVGKPGCEDDFLIEDCECRKPKAGLLRLAIDKYCIDVSRSYFLGDSEKDILAGKSVGLKTVFIDRFGAKESLNSFKEKPDLVIGNLSEFTRHLKGKEGVASGKN